MEKVNGIKGELYGYQKEGIEFLLNSGGRALLADSPGVGKTAQALGYVTHSKHERTLVVCPASVKFSWENEIEKWTDLTSFVVDSKTDLTDIPFDVNVIIINFDILKKFFNEFMKYKWDCMIVDESHLIKSSKAIRTKVVKGISRNIKSVIMLTGTPLLSRPIEMFNLLNIIDPASWGNYYHFACKYCTPAESPIWMGDYSFKPISEIRVGDEIIGWKNEKNGLQDKLIRTRVLEKFQKIDKVMKITMESGKIIRCTTDHQWLSPWYKMTCTKGTNRVWKKIKKKGDVLVKVIDIPDKILDSEKWSSGYLAGISDGEGTGMFLSQSKKANPIVYQKIKESLIKLKLDFTEYKKENGFHIGGGRQGLVNFINKVNPPKKNYKRIDKYTLGSKFRTLDRVVDIKYDGEEEVFGMKTESGNYVVWGYASKNCEGHQGYWGFEAKGASNLEELREKIKKYFLRRTKEEVLPELPPKNRINIPINLQGDSKKQYDLVEENLVKYLRTYKKEKTDKEILKSLQAEKLVKLNLLREINAMGKLETAKELIDSIIESGEKVIVFSSFNGPLLELSDEYEENSVLLLGSTPVDERGEMVKRFQTDPNCNVFIGGTKSAGVGITLTAASNVIFLDLPWNPADLEQGENRAHRPGALYQSLNIYQIISRDTIDAFMKRLLESKQKIIDQLMIGEVEEEEENMIDEYIKQLEMKYK